MQDLEAPSLSGMTVLGQNNLMESLWNQVAALDNSAGLMGLLSTIRPSASKGASAVGSEKLSISGTKAGLDLSEGSNSSDLNQALNIVGPISSATSISQDLDLSLFSQPHHHQQSTVSDPNHVDPLTGFNEGAALVSNSTTSLFKWDTAASSAIERSEGPPNAVVNGKLYVFGGFYNDRYQATTRSDVFDPATNTWRRIADMPIPVTHLNTAVDGQTIWFAGGFQGNHPGPVIRDVWKYHVASDTWSQGPSLPEARAAGALVRLGRELHYFGGFKADRNVTTGDHWVLSLEGGTNWTTAAPLPNPRGHLSGVALDGKIYGIGGQYRHDTKPVDVNAVHAYNPATDTWKAVASLPIPRSHFDAGTTVLNDRLLIIGGRSNATGKSALNHVTEYDPATNTWIALPPLPVNLIAAVAQTIGNQIIVTNGGLNRTTSPQSTTYVGVLDNKWESSIKMPTALGEVAGGIIGNKLYLVGEGSSATLAYNLSTGSWSSASALAKRRFVGDHHAAEVYNGKLYLFGGLGSGAGKVQIYNPKTNAWGLGANMPFAAGSSSSTVIDKQIYVAGGIVGSSTTDKVAKYNPGTNQWTMLAPMQQGRNHAASTTDGNKLYIFGGRDGSNVPSNGFDTVQVYNPATNTWASSSDAGSTLAPLPQARGGMGKAVYFDGEFYVMGGETQNGAGATSQKVYDRVDIYNPLTNQWRFGTPMPTARHGIFPLLIAGRIHVAGGGIQAGHSSSSLLEIYNPSTFDPPVNHPPVVSLTNEALSYTENAGAVILENGATVNDPDSANFDTGTLTVQFIANGAPSDHLAIRNQGEDTGQIGISGNSLTYGGTTIGSFSGGTDSSTPLVITFNSSAGTSAVEALINHITYENTSDNPVTADRTVSFVLTDGDGGMSQSATKIIKLTAVNDLPVLVTNNGLTLNQGTAAVISNTALQVTDPDNNASEIIYTITDLPNHGTLQLDGTAIAIGDSFSQADINVDGLTYIQDGSEATDDSFTFAVSNGAGGTIDPTIFDIVLTT